MRRLVRHQFATLLLAWAAAGPSLAAGPPLTIGVGLFQPGRERNDATCRPLARHLAPRLGRPVERRTVDTREGRAQPLANGKTDLAPMGRWGHVPAHHAAGAQGGSTILGDGKPAHVALIRARELLS